MHASGIRVYINLFIFIDQINTRPNSSVNHKYLRYRLKVFLSLKLLYTFNCHDPAVLLTVETMLLLHFLWSYFSTVKKKTQKFMKQGLKAENLKMGLYLFHSTFSLFCTILLNSLFIGFKLVLEIVYVIYNVLRTN